MSAVPGIVLVSTSNKFAFLIKPVETIVAGLCGFHCNFLQRELMAKDRCQTLPVTYTSYRHGLCHGALYNNRAKGEKESPNRPWPHAHSESFCHSAHWKPFFHQRLQTESDRLLCTLSHLPVPVSRWCIPPFLNNTETNRTQHCPKSVEVAHGSHPPLCPRTLNLGIGQYIRRIRVLHPRPH